VGWRAVWLRAEQLEFLRSLRKKRLKPKFIFAPRPSRHKGFTVACEPAATAAMSPDETVIGRNAPLRSRRISILPTRADGIPMWDTGAPNLHRLPANYLGKASDPSTSSAGGQLCRNNSGEGLIRWEII
jgi:hypothetical protein